MKLTFLSLILLISSIKANAQSQYNWMDTSDFVLPNEYTSFINNDSISHAIIITPWLDDFLFRNKTQAFKQTYDRLTTLIEKDDKAYLTSNYAPGYYTGSKKLFTQTSKNYIDSLCKHPLIHDSARNILIDQVIYIKNHSLRAYAISAAPVYYYDTVKTERFHPVIKSYCALNKTPDFTPGKKDHCLFLDSVIIFPNNIPVSSPYFSAIFN